MQKLFICLIFMCIMFGVAAFAKDTQDPAISTQGIDIDQNVTKSKPTSEQKNEQKQSKNRSKKYLELKRKTQKQDYKRTIKQKELEYMEKRLEVKKNKLELLNSNSTSKGEKE
ncbi:MAG: hypothetical protein ACI37Q_03445 [Candidatus Gastranaerophilaceae bacterium]